MAVANQSVQNFAQSFAKSYAHGQQIDNQRVQQDEDNRIRDEKFQMLQAQQQDVVKRQFKQDFNDALFEADHYKNPKAVEQFMKSMPEEFGGQYLSGITDYDVTRGGMTVPPEIRQQYKNDTGFELPTDDRQAAEELRTGLMLNNKDGSTQYVDRRALGLGLGNYNTFKDKKLRDMGTDTMTASSLKTMSDKMGGYAMMDDKHKNIAIATYTDSKVLKQYMASELTSPATTSATDNVSTKVWQPENVTSDQKNALFDIQDGAGYEYKGRQDRIDEIATVANFDRVTKVIDSMQEVDRQEVGNLMTAWATRASEEDWKSLKPSERKKALNKVGINTTANLAAMELVKLMSGAAVTEDEFARYQDALFGGGVDKMNLPTLRATLGSATESLYNKAKTQIANIGGRTPYDKVDLAQKLEDVYSGKPDVSPTGGSSEETGVKIPEVAKRTAVKLGEQAIEGVSDLTGGVVDAVFGNKDEPATGEDEWSFMNVLDNSVDGVTNFFAEPKNVEQVKVHAKKANANGADVQKVISNGVKPSELGTPHGQVALNVATAGRKASELSKVQAKFNSMEQVELDKMFNDPKTKESMSTAEYNALISVMTKRAFEGMNK